MGRSTLRGAIPAQRCCRPHPLTRHTYHARECAHMRTCTQTDTHTRMHTHTHTGMCAGQEGSRLRPRQPGRGAGRGGAQGWVPGRLLPLLLAECQPPPLLGEVPASAAARCQGECQHTFGVCHQGWDPLLLLESAWRHSRECMGCVLVAAQGLVACVPLQLLLPHCLPLPAQHGCCSPGFGCRVASPAAALAVAALAACQATPPWGCCCSSAAEDRSDFFLGSSACLPGTHLSAVLAG